MVTDGDVLERSSTTVVDLLPDETVMRLDNKMYGGFIYIVDGVVKECEYFRGDLNSGITVEEYMRRFQASEVRRCDITTRFPEPNGTDRSVWDRDFYTQMGDDVSFRRSMQSFREGLIGKPHHWDASGRTICQAKRRRRSSNKIKKVK